MARYTGSTNRISRRLGFSTLENSKDIAKRPYAPGQHGNKGSKKLSNYGVQLQEKQKLRFMYGLNEKQFHSTFEKAGKMKGVHGDNLFKLLESRLDNLVYRLGFSTTRRGARQLVNHGHITVNGKKVDIPSYTCKPGDVIAVKDNAKDMVIIKTSTTSRYFLRAWMLRSAKDGTIQSQLHCSIFSSGKSSLISRRVSNSIESACPMKRASGAVALQ